MSRSLVVFLCLAVGCDGADDPNYQGQIDSMNATIEELQSQHAALSDTVASQAEALAALEGELAAITGAVDLTALSDTVDTIAADYLVSSDLDGYATEAWVGKQAYAAASDVAANTADITSNAADIAVNDGSISANASDIASNASDVGAIAADYLVSSDLDGYATEDWVERQEYSTDGVEGLSDYVTVDTANDEVIFSGANIYVQSGSGRTSDSGSLTGLGNLIVGYDEDSGDTKSGSHNLVIGSYHSYTSYGGLIAGYNNELSAPHASVAGGTNSTAGGNYAFIGGGDSNIATGSSAAVVGGHTNTASGAFALVSGGNTNTASANVSLVTGGGWNTADGQRSVVLGGQFNLTSNYDAAIVGGSHNEVEGENAVVCGGYLNSAGGYYSSVFGGQNNTASSSYGVAP